MISAMTCFRGIKGVALGLLLAAALLQPAFAQEQKIIKSWAMSEFGEPLYKDGLEHWPYVNPDAPKGGKIVLGAFGTFDTLNPIILKGEFPSSIGHTFDSLMVASSDELLSAYGLIAESVEYPEDVSWAIFNIRPEARFNDGMPITAHDFKYSFEMVREHGRPFLKSFRADIVSAEVLSEQRIKYSFKTRDSMKPLMIAAGFSPLAKHYWKDRDISKTTLEPPVSSGAYRIKTLSPGRSITYERIDDYWAADLPVSRGLYNFDEIRYDYYRDETVEFEAFKAGEIDFRGENSAKRWTTGYDIDPVKKGDMVTRVVPDENPRGIGAFFFNLRQPQFHDKRVREAITFLYDFEAIQRTLLYGHYKRIRSYFPNSDYGASGPPTSQELTILEPFMENIPQEVMSKAFEPPVTDGSGRNRQNRHQALRLFKAAGWEVKAGKLINVESGKQLTLEIMTAAPETERLSAPFIQSMKRAGIDASIRVVDVPQWRNRIEAKDFDIYAARNNFFPPPGSELYSYFGSESADDPGGGNRMGYKSDVADALIEQIISAKDLETLKATTRALDRVMLWNFNLVPLYYSDESWIAYWNRFGRPDRKPRYSVGFPDSWWLDAELAAGLRQK